MIELKTNGIYTVELCSGEHRRWRYLGPDARASIWWRDEESGLEFNEGSVMYAWQVVLEQDDSPADA